MSAGMSIQSAYQRSDNYVTSVITFKKKKTCEAVRRSDKNKKAVKGEKLITAALL